MGYLFGVLATFGGNVQRLRERGGFKTAKSLADALEVAASVVSRWENDQTGLPEAPTLLKLAKTVRCSVEELLDGVDPDYQEMMKTRTEAAAVVDAFAPDANEADFVDIDVGQYVKGDIPVLGYAEATTDGLIAWTDEGIVRNQVEQWISRPSWIRDKRAYALIVRGDSMVPRYLPGELIIASPNAVVSSGTYACVILKSGERMIKQVYKEQNGWNLISTNASYPPKFVRDDDVVAVHKIVHNSQDAVSVTKEELQKKLRTTKPPKGVRQFVDERHTDRGEADSPDKSED